MNALTPQVRSARREDAAQVRESVEQLLRELSGDESREVARFDDTFRALLESPMHGGCVVVASGERLIGVLTYSRQLALRTGGNYLVIQELWVSPGHRGAGNGERLIHHLIAEHPGEIVEVGLPPASFVNSEATHRFYRRVGFALLGDRMRFAAP